MRISPTRALLIGASSLLLFTAQGSAQIERLSLEQMVGQVDDCVHGTIVDREVFRVDHPVDGPELYFTTVHIQGHSVLSGQEQLVQVTFHGGFVDEENGVYNSEAPSADETRIGRKIVAFHKWTENMGGDVAANVLYAAHGGLYTTFGDAQNPVIQGRGEGYAVTSNVVFDQFQTRVREIREASRRGR
jgi:hypothetical protein